MLGFWIRSQRHHKLLLLFVSAPISSFLFYLITNTGAWVVIADYPKTLAGWWQALTTGLPGFPRTLLFPQYGFQRPLLHRALRCRSNHFQSLSSDCRGGAFYSPHFNSTQAVITMETLADSYADAAINRQLTKEDKIRLLREMYRIRRFEQTSLKYYNLGKMGGFLHLYSGQEAVAVGTISLLGENDHVITAYRDHGHALAAGMDHKACMAELFGKATGCSKGKGGSMHFFAPDKNYWGGHGIVGGQTPLGAGIAFAIKYKGLRGCCLCYLGDGAINQGPFHESLNLAALFKLPVIYIIENNGYSMGTSQQRSSAYRDTLAQRAEAYNMAWDVFKGEDIYEVRAKTQIAIDRAYHESEPTLLEIQTYRYYGHSVADANAKKYRDTGRNREI